MMIDDLKRLVRQNSRSDNKAHVLNLIKEGIQTYILYFIYTNNRFKDLVFTGGTCLRRVYGLNRLSVDLDLDHETGLEPANMLAKEIKEWFRKEQQIKEIETSAAVGRVKIKLVNANELFEGMNKRVVFVSVDLSPVPSKKCRIEHNLISTPEFSFIVKNFDLATMFANKICAFLTRDFRFGKEQTASFKARDVYDLFWLCQRSKHSQYQLRPNFDVLSERLMMDDKKQVLKLLNDKIALLEDKSLKEQLLPFFPDPQFVVSFVQNYRETLLNDLKAILE